MGLAGAGSASPPGREDGEDREDEEDGEDAAAAAPSRTAPSPAVGWIPWESSGFWGVLTTVQEFFHTPLSPAIPRGEQTRGCHFGAASLRCRCPLKPSRRTEAEMEINQCGRSAPKQAGLFYRDESDDSSAGNPWDRKSLWERMKAEFPSRAGWEVTGRAQGIWAGVFWCMKRRR